MEEGGEREGEGSVGSTKIGWRELRSGVRKGRRFDMMEVAEEKAEEEEEETLAAREQEEGVEG
eukprot:748637-Hanusia_phi.AAC.1